MSENSIQSLAQGNRVIHRAHPEFGFGVVRYVEQDAFGDERLQVAFDHIDNLQNVAPDELEKISQPLEDAGALGSLAAFKRKLAAGLVIGENNLTGGFTRAAVQPLPHQAFVLDKVLAADRFGHVLADDVGLGKTIEAGLLITCLMRREPPQRIMVVCPAGLALQWQDEMDEHFGLTFAILGENFDGKRAASWRTQPLVIAPIDRLKREEYRELLKQVGAFDLVLCDEAHRLTAQRRFLTQKLDKTANYQLFEFLVESRLIRYVENNDKTPRSPRLLLLSATPHQGDDERFLYLLHLARPDLFQPGEGSVPEQLTAANLSEALTRTPKSRAVDWDGKPIFKGHKTTTLDVHWTQPETEVSRLLTEYILKSLDFARGSDRSHQLVVQLVMHTFHKIAASSWVALENALRARLDSISGRAARLTELIQDNGEDQAEDLPDFVLPAREFFENERALLEDLLGRIHRLETDSKWQSCQRLLEDAESAEPGVKILFFTQYRATLGMLQTRLPSLFPGAGVEIIHGDIPLEERRSARVRFENASRFLLSTEAGGEGVNLHRACHVMINYDLPWNPMRLQQRIGRLDRYGQKEVVRVFNLRVPDSWDSHISTRILERIDVIQRTMTLAGSGAVEDYREMILGQVAEQIDASALFAAYQTGHQISESDVDSWIRGAVASIERWRKLFDSEVGMSGDTTRLKPTLTSEDFKTAYRLCIENHSIRLRESRNSQNQYVPGVYNFDAPDAFRDPVIRPSRTMHVVFDREVFAGVRGQDLGTVRGQTIRPLLTGFGEPFTDWLFQTAMHARRSESLFSLKTGNKWSHGSGWLLVYAARWLAKARRLSTPDSVIPCFIEESDEVTVVTPREGMALVEDAEELTATGKLPSPEGIAAAGKCAQKVLRDIAVRRDPSARAAANLSLLLAASIQKSP
ncbi:MAG TPA: DEAD/DEAH box helicase [Verrucomicrobiae bacterium]